MARPRRPFLAVPLVLACLVAGDVRADAPSGGEPDTVNVVLRLGQRRLYVVPSEHADDTRRSIVSFPVAIGRPEYATPTGRFEVEEKVEDPEFVQFDWDDPGRELGRIEPGPRNPLGVRWIGFTWAHGWRIGFHGTPQPELLGKAVSHGCVRMRNADVMDLYGRVQVGTPVIVRP
jgi:lipoprotein-anchoring transpeptidase ErfK/SrfK